MYSGIFDCIGKNKRFYFYIGLLIGSQFPTRKFCDSSLVPTVSPRESRVAKDCSDDARRAGISMSTQEGVDELQIQYAEATLTEPEL